MIPVTIFITYTGLFPKKENGLKLCWEKKSITKYIKNHITGVMSNNFMHYAEAPVFS